MRGFSILAAGSILGQLIGFLALAYVARRVGPTNLGAYSFALALVTYFGLLSTFGMNNLGTRDVAQDHRAASATISETLLLQSALAVGLYGLLVALSPWIVANQEARHMVPIVGLTLITTAFTLDWALLALGKFNSVAGWRLAGQVAYAALIPILVVSGSAGAFRYAWLNVIGLAITALGVTFVALRVSNVPLHLAKGRALLTRMRRSLPFGYSLIMIQIYAAIGAVMLGYLDSTHAVGIYTVANKLPAGLVVLANVWINAFLPHTARRLVVNPTALAHDLGRILTAVLSISIALCVGSIICAHGLMPLLFGHAFQSASGPFGLLAIAGSLVLIQANFSNVLRGERYYTVAISFAAGMIVALNFVFIPIAGVLGCAIATVTGELSLTLVTYVGVRRRLGPIPLDIRRLLRAMAAICLTAAGMIAVPALGGGIELQICLGILVFVLMSTLMKVFDTKLLSAT